jgi:pimeloyl-ACP methyl ester carboxylesterase
MVDPLQHICRRHRGRVGDVTTETDLTTPDGRTLHAYDHGGPGVPVFWLHGTPNIGAPPAPLFADAERLGLRWLGYDRPGYGGSTERPGRSAGSAAADIAAVADALGVDTFAVMGHSGGGPHALAAAALLPGRVVAVVSGAGPAPYDVAGLDWFAGMGPHTRAGLEAALRGRAAKEAFEAGAEGEPDFVPADWAALEGEWGWFGSVVVPAMAHGPGPLIDDDLALVAPWGFDVGDVRAPTLLLHGADDAVIPAAHSAWLATRIAGSVLRVIPGHGHVSVLVEAPAALGWLADAAR